MSDFSNAVIKTLIRPGSVVLSADNNFEVWAEAIRRYCPLARISSLTEDEALDLSGQMTREGRRHVHLLCLPADRAHEILRGAARPLRHSRIDIVAIPQCPSPDLSHNLQDHLRTYGYEVFAWSDRQLKHMPTWQETMAKQPFVCLHHRLIPLLFNLPKRGLNLGSLCRHYGIVPKNFIHVGAHEGHEWRSYREFGVKQILFVEANPEVFSRLSANLRDVPDVTLINCAITEIPGPVRLHVTSADQSSSILPLAGHLDIYPNIVEEKVIEVPGKTIDSLLEELRVAPEDFNLLHLDIQGAELMALRGATKTLRHIAAVSVEVNFEELYKGCAQIEDIDDYLSSFGFRRVATTTPYDASWGDAFYVRDGEPEVDYNAAMLLARSGDLKGAAVILRNVAARHPDVFPVLFDLAQMEEALQRPDAALQAYEGAIAANPGHAGPFTRRAVLLLRKAFGEPLPMPAEKSQRKDIGQNGRITMSTLGWNGRFGNQLLQYACLRAVGDVHGLAVEAPEWIGRWLFDLTDPLPRTPLSELREDGDNLAQLMSPGSTSMAASNRDLWGYCCYNTRFYQPHRDLMRRLFIPGARIRPFADAAMNTIAARGKTLVALHLRRGDFGYGRFWIAPETWYLDWLQSLWPQLDRPVLYIASDDDQIFRKFAAYSPVTAADLGPPISGAEFYIDFHVLTQADHLAISNSSFSFVAGLLNARAHSFVRPDLANRHLVAYDPWASDVLLPNLDSSNTER